MGEHKRFTAETTAYRPDRDNREPTWAVLYQDPPRPGSEPSTTTHSLRFPCLVVADYAANPQGIAEKVARLLERHWDDPE